MKIMLAWCPYPLFELVIYISQFDSISQEPARAGLQPAHSRSRGPVGFRC